MNRTRDALSTPRHAFNHAPAALRIFRFAADTAPRVLELAHVSACLRECAVEFGSADATLPGALRNEYASGRYFKLREVVERNDVRCWWLAAKLLACRGGAPVPAAALAPDVTRHDVNWGAEGARRHEGFAVSGGGSALMLIGAPPSLAWAQGAVGVTSGKHYFQVCITQSTDDRARVGWVDRALRTQNLDELGPGNAHSTASGAVVLPLGFFFFGKLPLSLSQCKAVAYFGTAPLSTDQSDEVPEVTCPCTVGCLLDADAGAMTVFVNGEALEHQCDYKFPTDREWAPTVALWDKDDALFSNTV
jgi:hypothetical protein